MSYIGTTEIGKMFLGTTEIDKAYLGSTLVFQSGSSPTPPVPSGIAYIRNSGDAYIDTGITPDNTTRVIVWARNFNPVSYFLFGSRDGASSNTFGIGTFGTTNVGRIRVDYGQSNSTFADDQFANLSWYHKYELYDGVLKVDDVTLATASSATFSNNHNIHLFGVNDNGTHAANNLPIDICACKIYKGGVLVRDFTAVNSPSIGLYDLVSDTVFTNSGTGNFTFGTFDENAFTPIQYISCSNAQYIDTGIYGTKPLSVVIKLQIRGTSLGNNSVFGTMRSGTSGTYLLLQTGNATYKNRYMNFYIDGTTNNQIYNNNSTKLTNLDVVFVKNDTTARLVRNNATFGTSKTFSASSSFTTSPDTLLLCGLKSGGAYHAASLFNGYLYFAGFGGERNYVPAKVGGVAGLYDTYNDTFHPSESETAFVAGPEIN